MRAKLSLSSGKLMLTVTNPDSGSATEEVEVNGDKAKPAKVVRVNDELKIQRGMFELFGLGNVLPEDRLPDPKG